MVELLRDDFERERLGEAGKKRAEKFSWRQCVSLTRAVYREALGS
jgi:glycosyltransferase involved in cell wall biosynthesis